MHRTIRKQLEGRLSADALDYLNEEFRKAEEIMLKIKELEKKEEMLLDQLVKKDEMIRSLFEKSSQSSGGSIGYQSQGFSPNYFSNPEEQYQRKSNTPQFEMRRGGNRSEFGYEAARRGGGSRNEMMANQGGQGGSSGGGTSNHYLPYPVPYFEEQEQDFEEFESRRGRKS